MWPRLLNVWEWVWLLNVNPASPCEAHFLASYMHHSQNKKGSPVERGLSIMLARLQLKGLVSGKQLKCFPFTSRKTQETNQSCSLCQFNSSSDHIIGSKLQCRSGRSFYQSAWYYFFIKSNSRKETLIIFDLTFMFKSSLHLFFFTRYKTIDIKLILSI